MDNKLTKKMYQVFCFEEDLEEVKKYFKESDITIIPKEVKIERAENKSTCYIIPILEEKPLKFIIEGDA